MKNHYDNSERLEAVSDKQWRDALDELTAYLRWRLKGRTQRGAHSERELGMPALDYYQEEAVVKLIEGDWKWQDRFTLGKQLERIAADLITKQVQKWEREHPWLTEDGTPGVLTLWPVSKPRLPMKKDEKLDTTWLNQTPLDVLLVKKLEELKAQERLYMYRIAFPQSAAVELYQYLEREGHTVAKLFPGYGGVARSIIEADKFKGTAVMREA